ncbi:MAG: type II toxin-antitoxin system prevent-host-death family antitoxin [Veillonella sp.]|nr:type II toxin-antitoxin system prevent-host-death family antitoxin [Veillonella sp.]MCF0156209.1 type II toxin-antitoxin system prevent-host-death family antitoxin [Veillonella sp.]
MPKIKPISDLRNYNTVLQEVSFGSPVYLTKNGHGKYAIIDIEEYEEIEQLRAHFQLASALEQGRRSGEEEGYLSIEDVKALLEG